jgi:hypothetical protein
MSNTQHPALTQLCSTYLFLCIALKTSLSRWDPRSGVKNEQSSALSCFSLEKSPAPGGLRCMLLNCRALLRCCADALSVPRELQSTSWASLQIIKCGNCKDKKTALL